MITNDPTQESQLLMWILAVICVLVGIAGTVLPALPGTPLVFGGLLLAAWIDDFQKVGWPSLTLLGVLTVVTLVVDLAAVAMGSKKVGASRTAIIGSMLGLFIGMFLGLPGIIFGPFLGAGIGEMLHTADVMRAGKVGFVTWISLLIATTVKLGITFAMLGVFAFAYLI